MKHGFNGGFFLDVGANDGVTYSKTWAMRPPQWAGICIEANPTMYERLKKDRETVGGEVRCLQHCLSSKSNSNKVVNFFIGDRSGLSGGIISGGDFDNSSYLRWNSDKALKDHAENVESVVYDTCEMKTVSLGAVLDSNECPKVIEYAKFDVEGAETDILSDFEFDKYTFLFVVIERSTLKLNNILENNSFSYIGRDDIDDYYVHKEHPLYSEFKKQDFNHADYNWDKGAPEQRS